MVSSMSASASEIRVFSGGAPQEVFAALVPKFEQQTGHKVSFVYEVITALRERIAKGETADVLVMPVPVLDGYAKDGKLRADARATSARRRQRRGQGGRGQARHLDRGEIPRGHACRPFGGACDAG